MSVGPSNTAEEIETAIQAVTAIAAQAAKVAR
jgi:hypothetical protein